jgi:hypothetical protein
MGDRKDVWIFRQSRYDVEFTPDKWEIQDGQLAEDAFHPHGVEGFSHTQENRAS